MTNYKNSANENNLSVSYCARSQAALYSFEYNAYYFTSFAWYYFTKFTQSV